MGRYAAHPGRYEADFRLPAGLLAELKTLANKRDVPYQSLMKVLIVVFPKFDPADEWLD